MQVGESSLAPSAPAPTPPPPTPATGVGSLQIEVKHISVCWDTSPDGQPTAHEGATVVVTCGGRQRVGNTDAQGRATIDNIPVGTADITVSHQRYVTHSTTANITAGGTTNASLELELTENARGCDRQHSQPPSGRPSSVKQDALFWASWWPITLLHQLWTLAMMCFVVFTLITIVDISDGTMHFPLGGFSLVAVLFGTVAFLSHIIFGELVGIPLILLAGVSWVVVIVLTVLGAAGSLPTVPVNIVWFPTLCSLWTGFLVGLFTGRVENFRAEFDWWYIAVFAAVGVVVGLVLYFVLTWLTAPAFWATGGWVFLLFWLVLIMVALWGLIGAATGHMIVNDHRLTSFASEGEPKLLPYAGEYYCVQGNRGWFSHFGNEIHCYDFEVPQRTRVLAIEEGHVVRWLDENEFSIYESTTSNDPNFIYVQHKDGSVARYLHLKKNGVREINPELVAHSEDHDGGPAQKSDVHVHAGQVLALAGSTGKSRFPHIHLGLYEDADGDLNLGMKFRDASTDRHGGKCYTFRAYLSDNRDCDVITVEE